MVYIETYENFTIKKISIKITKPLFIKSVCRGYNKANNILT
jgi:hypothetical protein